MSNPASTARTAAAAKSAITPSICASGHGRRRRVAVECAGAGTHGVPAALGRRHAALLAGERPVGGRFPAGVRQLGADLGLRGAVAVHEGGDAFPRRGLVVVVEAGVAGADPARGVDGVGLGEDQGRSPGGEGAQMHQVPVCGHALARRRARSCTGTSATPSRGAAAAGTSAPAARRVPDPTRTAPGPAPGGPWRRARRRRRRRRRVPAAGPGRSPVPGRSCGQ